MNSSSVADEMSGIRAGEYVGTLIELARPYPRDGVPKEGRLKVGCLNEANAAAAGDP